MEMNTERHAAEKGIRRAGGEGTHRSDHALLNRRGKRPRSLCHGHCPPKRGEGSATNSPAPRSRQRWCPCCPFVPRIAAWFPAAPPKDLHKDAWPLSTLKEAMLSPLLWLGQRKAERTGHQQQWCSHLLLPARLGQRGETSQDSKTRISCTNLGSCCHHRCTGDIRVGVTEHQHERHSRGGRGRGARALL